MKKLMVAMVAVLSFACAFGAQCEGKTKLGERCKREAAEGSKFCIGHADQAVKAEAKAAVKKAEAKKGEAKGKAKARVVEAKAKADEAAAVLKDDGTCWAATEAGTRCKAKKVGDTDYCEQHAATKKPAKAVTRCRALKYDGEQCTRKPVENCYYCEQHRKLGIVAAPAKKGAVSK